MTPKRRKALQFYYDNGQSYAVVFDCIHSHAIRRRMLKDNQIEMVSTLNSTLSAHQLTDKGRRDLWESRS